MTTENMIRTVARAICKSRTCEGVNCCQWPCNGGQWRGYNSRIGPCRVEEGRYDDAAKAAIEALQEPLPIMMQLAEGYADFILPDGVGPNTPEGRVAEMTYAWKMAIRVAAGTFPKPRTHGQTGEG